MHTVSGLIAALVMLERRLLGHYLFIVNVVPLLVYGLWARARQPFVAARPI